MVSGCWASSILAVPIPIRAAMHRRRGLQCSVPTRHRRISDGRGRRQFGGPASVVADPGAIGSYAERLMHRDPRMFAAILRSAGPSLSTFKRRPAHTRSDARHGCYPRDKRCRLTTRCLPTCECLSWPERPGELTRPHLPDAMHATWPGRDLPACPDVFPGHPERSEGASRSPCGAPVRCPWDQTRSPRTERGTPSAVLRGQAGISRRFRGLMGVLHSGSRFLI